MNGPGDKLRAFMNKFIKPKGGHVVEGRDTDKALKKLKKQGLEDPKIANEILYNKKTPDVEELNQQMVKGGR